MYGGQGKNRLLNINQHELSKTKKESGGHREDQAIQDVKTLYSGLSQPRLNGTDEVILGHNKTKMRRENKQRRQNKRAKQQIISPWTSYKGVEQPTPLMDHTTRLPHWNSMCPTRRTLEHPVAPLLSKWAQFGCPTKTGQPWTKEEIWEAVARGPHRSAFSQEAIEHFAIEAEEKVRTKQAKIVDWDSIKDNPPKEFKILPIAAIPHKSKAYRSNLDLSFRLQLKNSGVRAAMNDTTKKTAPKGAIDKMSWNVAMDYTENPINLLPPHKFVKYTIGNSEY